MCKPPDFLWNKKNFTTTMRLPLVVSVKYKWCVFGLIYISVKQKTNSFN